MTKVGLVAGASGGIGEAVARQLAPAFKLYLTACRSEARIAALAEELPGAVPYLLDLRESDAIEQLCAAIYEKEGRLDVLVNCAAVNQEGPALGMTDQSWDEVMAVNLSGAFRLCRSVAKYMLLQKSGKIVNISSIAAGVGGRGQINYASAKAGLNAMTRVLALELGRKGILVNSVAPGCIETEMSRRVRGQYGDSIIGNIALQRFGKPAEVAGLVEFLVSDACSYMTGQVLRIDGGYRL